MRVVVEAGRRRSRIGPIGARGRVGGGGAPARHGAFTAVGGVPQRGLARLSLDGRRVSGFQATIDHGDVKALAVRADDVYAGGTFSAVDGVRRAGFARLDAYTGAVDSGFDAELS